MRFTKVKQHSQQNYSLTLVISVEAHKKGPIANLTC